MNPNDYITRTRETYGHRAAVSEEHLAVNWGSERGQRTRAEVLVAGVPKRARSIVDLGCGRGFLYPILHNIHPEIAYTGIDLLPEMIAEARSRHPEVVFTPGDVFAADHLPPADFGLASGLFTVTETKTLKETVRRLFNHFRLGVGFNVLSTLAPAHQSDECRADPLDILTFAFTLTRNVSLRHDYFPHDFTVFLYKAQ